MDKQPSRQACDRCHDLKLRCHRAPNGGDCSRCVKAGATCVFSPSNRGRRPTSLHNKTTPSARTGQLKLAPRLPTPNVPMPNSTVANIDPSLVDDLHRNILDIQPPPLPYGYPDTSPFPQTDFPLSDTLSTWTPPHEPRCPTLSPLGENHDPFPTRLHHPPDPNPSPTHTQSLVQFTRDLLNLDSDLIHHIHEDPVTHTPPTPTLGSTTACAIDHTLSLTQRLIRLLHDHPPALDQVSLMHTLSTYIRLLEAYNITFTHTIRKYGRPAVNSQARIPLPPLQIGGFAVDDPAAQLALVFRSAMQLLDRLRELVRQVADPFVIEATTSNGNAGPGGVIGAMMVAVRGHEGRMLLRAEELRESCCEFRG
ncbi:hypothetical protein BDV23DRAFT_185928 [Aspergillus alliaceus]|uniref:Zn(2)-C6 fungal-type domain-containing protein n=1 Tax=Petromyces alliaceus TaxID=209559 RepID=A0A5N7C2H8_PETAA|nr:hypothetical protein BDV23DRAFT_185928 [Aspergillus alliaceus]